MGPGDLSDKAVRWALGQPQLQQLMYDCYVTHNTRNDARRFYSSDEFAETLRILSALVLGPNRDSWLLDMGAGNGIASYAFARSGYKVVALDFSQSEVAGLKAARSLQRFGEVQFDIVVADAINLGFVKEAFDVIYARQFLHHIKDLGRMVIQLARLLKPGGVLCATREIVVWSEEQRQRFLSEHPLNHITQDEGAFYLKEYRLAFSGAGLRMSLELHPCASIINVFPDKIMDIRKEVQRYLPEAFHRLWKIPAIDRISRKLMAWHRARHRYQLYSFFGQKPPYTEFSAKQFL